jgi:hypothetical protein
MQQHALAYLPLRSGYCSSTTANRGHSLTPITRTVVKVMLVVSFEDSVVDAGLLRQVSLAVSGSSQLRRRGTVPAPNLWRSPARSFLPKCSVSRLCRDLRKSIPPPRINTLKVIFAERYRFPEFFHDDGIVREALAGCHNRRTTSTRLGPEHFAPRFRASRRPNRARTTATEKQCSRI